MLDDLKSHNKYIGLKQSLRAIEKGEASVAYVAKDAAPDIYKKIVSKCQAKGVEIEYVATMKELGDACKIDVGAAIAVLLR